MLAQSGVEMMTASIWNDSDDDEEEAEDCTILEMVQ